jgi:hypothetical protein
MLSPPDVTRSIILGPISVAETNVVDDLLEVVPNLCAVDFVDYKSKYSLVNFYMLGIAICCFYPDFSLFFHIFHMEVFVYFSRKPQPILVFQGGWRHLLQQDPFP